MMRSLAGGWGGGSWFRSDKTTANFVLFSIATFLKVRLKEKSQ